MERSITMRVGTIVKLKVNCLGNLAGTLGVVFYDYGDGIQAIFENGNYDGFSTKRKAHEQTEEEYFLEEVGFEESLACYQFKNVVSVARDYKIGRFNIAWSEVWKQPTVIEEQKCRICGCIDTKACEGGWWWALPGICSKCVKTEVPECISLLVEVIMLTHKPDEIDKDHHGDKHPCSICQLIDSARKIEQSLRR
jgi:hypothetical protein